MSRLLGVIGGGNMGSAIVRGAVDRGVLGPEQIIIAEVDAERRSRFDALGCRTTDQPADVLECEQVMLAVKPQGFADVAGAIAGLPRSMVVISIMAGVGSGVIRSALGAAARVVRIMPNTPCRLGAGMSAIALGEGAREGDDALAWRLFESIGRCLRVDESLMHTVTAVSGSGPAYVFLLAEAMEQAAMQQGLSLHDARLLVVQTILGAGRLLSEGGQTACELRQAVTSPGGTTAAALEVLFEQEMPETIAEAILAARNRSQELDQMQS